MAANPMYQFNVYKIGPEIKIGEIDLSFTNASLFMILSSITILIIFNIGSKKNTLIPNKIQLLSELSYSFVSKMIRQNLIFHLFFHYSCLYCFAICWA